MKFALLCLLFLQSCSTSLIVKSDIAFSKKERVEGRWIVYYGDKFTAYMNEDAGDKAILVIPIGMHGRTFQFKKRTFTVISTEEYKEAFITTIQSDEDIIYRVVLYSRQHIGQTFQAWIPR